MRESLKNGTDELQTFTASFDHLALKRIDRIEKGHRKLTPTICLKNLRDEEGNLVSDHVWLNYDTAFRKLGILQKNDQILFRSRSKKYHKGIYKEKVDYKIAQPRKVKLLTQHKYQPMPIDKQAVIGYIMCLKGEKGGGNYTKAYHEWAFNNR